VLTVSCEAGPGLLRGIQRHRHHAAGDSSWVAYFQANNEDFNFWSEEWAVTKTQLVRLSLLNGINPRNRTGSAAKSPEAESEEKLRTANSTVKLNLLKSSIDYAKSRIERLKGQEQKSLKRYTEQEAGHKRRQAGIDARYHNKTLITEFYQSNTKEESRQWGSWEKQRNRQQEQLKASEAIQEGAMKKAQVLVEVYEKNSKPSSAQQQAMKDFCHNAWAEVKKKQTQLENSLPGTSLLQI
jgi:hypothetical protein